MHITERCVFEEYQILKKLCKSNKTTVIKIIKTILILRLCKLCIFVNLFMFLWNFEQASVGDLKENNCGQNLLVKFVLWLSIKITFLRLILN